MYSRNDFIGLMEKKKDLSRKLSDREESRSMDSLFSDSCYLRMLNELSDIVSELQHCLENQEPASDHDEIDSSFLFLIEKYLNENEVNCSFVDEAELRRRGKSYPLNAHLRGLVLAFLSNQRKWEQIELHIPEIDNIFFNYDPELILSKSSGYFVSRLHDIGCGNRAYKKQMADLPDNIRVLRLIESEHGSIDAYLSSQSVDETVKSLTSNNSPYRIRNLGKALVMEYLKNVGIDAVKPDVHLRRFFSCSRMGNGKAGEAAEEEVIGTVRRLSEKTGLTMSRIDSLIWNFSASGKGEVCTKVPRCNICPLTAYCHYKGEHL